MFSPAKTIAPAVLFCACLAGAAQSRTDQSHTDQARTDLASVSTISLDPNTTMTLQPKSDAGIIFVAIDTCLLEVNGAPITLQPGERKSVRGTHAVTLSQDATSPATLVIVNVASAKQDLLFGKIELQPGDFHEDSTERTDMLLIAITPLKLADRFALPGDGEHLQWGQAQPMDLAKGQFLWLKPGLHHLLNRADSAARFLTIEW